MCQKIANSARMICKFCAPFLRILHKFCATFQPIFFYGTIVCDTGVLSRVSWLVGPLKLRVTIQLTLSVRLLTSGWPVYRCQPVSVQVPYSRALCEKKLTKSGILCNFNQARIGRGALPVGVYQHF